LFVTAKRLILLVPGEGFEPPTCGLQRHFRACQKPRWNRHNLSLHLGRCAPFCVPGDAASGAL